MKFVGTIDLSECMLIHHFEYLKHLVEHERFVHEHWRICLLMYVLHIGQELFGFR